MSRHLFIIPHYYTYAPDSDLGSEYEPREARSRIVARSIAAIRETFGRSLSVFPGHRSPDMPGNVVDIVVVTNRNDHLLADIGDSAKLVQHVTVDDAPMNLGFAAHRILADRLGQYDRYGYLEDDLVVHDPLLFAKQDWFGATFGSGSLLAPMRYEASGGLKVHPDGPLPVFALDGLRRPPGPDRLEGSWFGLNLAFERPSNPHSGCFFVDGAGWSACVRTPSSACHMHPSCARWRQQPAVRSPRHSACTRRPRLPPTSSRWNIRAVAIWGNGGPPTPAMSSRRCGSPRRSVPTRRKPARRAEARAGMRNASSSTSVPPDRGSSPHPSGDWAISLVACGRGRHRGGQPNRRATVSACAR